MPRRSIVFWNLQRLFAAEGSAIEATLRMRRREPRPEEGSASHRLAEKIATIGAVLDRIAVLAGPPLLVGLAEIETPALAQRVADAVHGAALTHVDALAPDRAGISLQGLNLSLLVDTDAVAEVEHLHSHVVDRTFDTRDILEVDLRLRSGQALSALVNHWPSRLASEAESRRLAAAHYVRNLVASKLRFSPAEMWNAPRRRLRVPTNARLEARASHPVVVMGDFNDEVFDDSLEVLNTTDDLQSVRDDLAVRGRSQRDRFASYAASVPRLLNPFWSMVGRTGSYYRSPRWRTYDQILLSRGFLGRRAPVAFDPDSAFIFDERTVERRDGQQVQLTNRGGKPVGHSLRRGCSDHFAVVVSVDVDA